MWFVDERWWFVDERICCGNERRHGKQIPCGHDRQEKQWQGLTRVPSATLRIVESGEGGVQVLDSFVDFLGVFVAHGDGVYAGVVEGEAHGFLAVFAVEDAFAY